MKQRLVLVGETLRIEAPWRDPSAGLDQLMDRIIRKAEPGHVFMFDRVTVSRPGAGVFLPGSPMAAVSLSVDRLRNGGVAYLPAESDTGTVVDLPGLVIRNGADGGSDATHRNRFERLGWMMGREGQDCLSAHNSSLMSVRVVGDDYASWTSERASALCFTARAARTRFLVCIEHEAA